MELMVVKRDVAGSASRRAVSGMAVRPRLMVMDKQPAEAVRRAD